MCTPATALGMHAVKLRSWGSEGSWPPSGRHTRPCHSQLCALVAGAARGRSDPRRRGLGSPMGRQQGVQSVWGRGTPGNCSAALPQAMHTFRSPQKHARMCALCFRRQTPWWAVGVPLLLPAEEWAVQEGQGRVWLPVWLHACQQPREGQVDALQLYQLWHPHLQPGACHLPCQDQQAGGWDCVSNSRAGPASACLGSINSSAPRTN